MRKFSCGEISALPGIFLWCVVAENDQLEIMLVCINVAPQGASISVQIMVTSLAHALHRTIKPNRLECGTPLITLGFYCYFKLKEKKRNLSLPPKVRVMLRQLLLSVVAHHDHYLSHWVIFQITMKICYMLSSCMRLSPTLSCPYAWHWSFIFCLLTT